MSVHDNARCTGCESWVRPAATKNLQLPPSFSQHKGYPIHPDFGPRRMKERTVEIAGPLTM